MFFLCLFSLPFFFPLNPPHVVLLFQAETLHSLTPPHSSPLRNLETSAATPATSPVELLIWPIKSVRVCFFFISDSLTYVPLSHLLPLPPKRPSEFHPQLFAVCVVQRRPLVLLVRLPLDALVVGVQVAVVGVLHQTCHQIRYGKYEQIKERLGPKNKLKKLKEMLSMSCSSNSSSRGSGGCKSLYLSERFKKRGGGGWWGSEGGGRGW